MSSKSVQAHYDHLNSGYLKCWESVAKKDIDRYELNFISCAIKRVKGKKKIKVLEIGVGPGRIAKTILQYPVEYRALDISPKMVEISKARFNSNPKVKKITEADISKEDPFPNETFDLIIAMRVIYYSKSWKEIIGKLTGKLNPRGALVFCTLNKYSSVVLGRLVNTDKLEGQYTSLDELKDILRSNHLKVTTLEGYARIPDVMYDLGSNQLFAATLRISERILSALLGKTLFMRMFYVIAQK